MEYREIRMKPYIVQGQAVADLSLGPAGCWARPEAGADGDDDSVEQPAVPRQLVCEGVALDPATLVPCLLRQCLVVDKRGQIG